MMHLLYGLVFVCHFASLMSAPRTRPRAMWRVGAQCAHRLRDDVVASQHAPPEAPLDGAAVASFLLHGISEDCIGPQLHPVGSDEPGRPPHVPALGGGACQLLALAGLGSPTSDSQSLGYALDCAPQSLT